MKVRQKDAWLFALPISFMIRRTLLEFEELVSYCEEKNIYLVIGYDSKPHGVG